MLVELLQQRIQNVKEISSNCCFVKNDAFASEFCNVAFLFAQLCSLTRLNEIALSTLLFNACEFSALIDCPL